MKNPFKNIKVGQIVDASSYSLIENDYGWDRI